MAQRNRSNFKTALPVKQNEPAEDTKAKATQPLTPPEKKEPVAITSHRSLVGSSRAIAERINADPAFSVMFLINPVLALQRYAVELSPEVKQHILHTLQHPKRLRTRRDELEAELRKALGEMPKPADEEWLATLLFKRLELRPLEIGEISPVYLPPLNAATLEALALKRPKGGTRYKGRRLIKVQSSVGSASRPQAPRRLDLDAVAPYLPPAKCKPDTISLVNLWFYKEANPLVRNVLEYGILQSRGFPFHSADSFRKIAEGREKNAFRFWIRTIHFQERTK